MNKKQREAERKKSLLQKKVEENKKEVVENQVLVQSVQSVQSISTQPPTQSIPTQSISTQPPTQSTTQPPTQSASTQPPTQSTPTQSTSLQPPTQSPSNQQQEFIQVPKVITKTIVTDQYQIKSKGEIRQPFLDETLFYRCM